MKKIYVIIVIAILFLGCGENTEESSTAGVDVPDFTLKNKNGETVRLSDFQDQNVLLVFWATWCPHCRAEIPRMKQIHEEYSEKDFKILTVSVDNNEETLMRYVEDNGIPYTVLFDQGTEVAKSYGVVGIPAHYVVDTGGNGYFFGPNLDLAMLKVDELLAE